MTAGLITAKANGMLDAIRTGGSSLTAVATVYAQLHTGDPGAAGTANQSANTTRVQVNHSAPSAGSMTLSNSPVWTNGGTGETLAGMSFWDASSGGNCLYTATFTGVPWTSGQQANMTSCTVSISPVAA